MAWAPPKSKRQYLGGLWKKNTDGTRGDLVSHLCAKCKQSNDGKARGTWFERADVNDVWVWVCSKCR